LGALKGPSNPKQELLECCRGPAAPKKSFCWSARPQQPLQTTCGVLQGPSSPKKELLEFCKAPATPKRCFWDSAGPQQPQKETSGVLQGPSSPKKKLLEFCRGPGSFRQLPCGLQYGIQARSPVWKRKEHLLGNRVLWGREPGITVFLSLLCFFLLFLLLARQPGNISKKVL
jgi:hypothetical protein